MSDIYRLTITYDDGQYDVMDVSSEVKEGADADETLQSVCRMVLDSHPKAASISVYKLMFTEYNGGSL